MNEKIKPVALIPHYNHSDTVEFVTRQLLAQGLPVLIVDDGSSNEHHSVLKALEQLPNVNVFFCETNGGKGAAVKTGLKLALMQGFTHALQVDADGQHNLSNVPEMLAKSQVNPNACLCGRPIYGQDAPKSRLYGRKITNFWLAINTLSFDLIDGMCGFRLYPLSQVVPRLDEYRTGNRMDFDIEILVLLHWHRVPLVWIDTQVTYQQGGISHFQGWQDNWLISKMHARCFWGMLRRVMMGRSV